jgi:methylated-DNA-[protein]-cysteine S-methyltransferase
MENIYATNGMAGKINFTLLWKSEPEFTVEHLLINKKPENSLKGNSPEAGELIKLIEEFLLGRNFNLPTDNLNTEKLPVFFKTVLFCLREKTSPGQVVTYGRLAGMSGSPNAGRAVGQAMSRNPFPLFFPCHRVLNSNRSLGNYGPGPDLKRKLLQNEGIVVEKNDIIAENFFI